MQKIEDQRAAMRVRLEAALGVRLGFPMDESAKIAGISKKSLYSSNIGFKVGGARRVDPAPGETYPQAVARVIAALDDSDRNYLRELVAWVLDYERHDRRSATAGTSP